MKRYFILAKTLWFLLFPIIALGQFPADFADGNMDQNPAWSGDTSNWQVVHKQLVSKGKATVKGNSYLRRPSISALNSVWTMTLNLKFKPSATNFAEIFLTADNADLTGKNNAYLLRIGGALREVGLYLKTGKSYEKLLSGKENSLINTKSNPLTIKVERDSAYGWLLVVDYTGQGRNFEKLGYKVDSTFTQSGYFGFVIHYTPSNAARFSFEKISCNALSDGTAETPPESEECNPSDLIINEVLFDPNPGGAAFVELRNRSTKVIDVSQLSLAKANYTTHVIETLTKISNEVYLLYPDDYLVLTAKPAGVQEEYPASKDKKFIRMARFPSFHKSTAEVVLLNSKGERIDVFSYSNTLHFSLLKSLKGVSLERRDPNRPTQDSTNWLSAAQQVGFATPGYKNSQDKAHSESLEIAGLDTEIFSPDNDGYNDVLSLSIHAAPGTTGTITIFDAAGFAVRALVKNELLGNASVFTWDGLTDLKEKAGIGIYVIYVSLFDNFTGKTEIQKLRCVLAGKLP